MVLDLLFPTSDGPVATDHSYWLFAALSHVVPAFHTPDSPLRFAPLPGVRGPVSGTLALPPRCHLRVRLPQDRIGDVLGLAGKRLEIGGGFLRLGVPSVTPLTPAATVAARVVVVKPDAGPKATRPTPRGKVTVEFGQFLDIVRRMLERAGIAAQVEVPFRMTNKRDGQPEPCRRVVRVKTKRMVGYAVTVSGLSAADSLRLQAEGLGGRRRIGCGFFLPTREAGCERIALGQYHTTGVALLAHTEAVVEAGEALFGGDTGPTQLGRAWLRFFKLTETNWPAFRRDLLAAMLLHD